MIRLLGKLPKSHFFLAASGGSDSMFALDFLRNSGRKFTVVNFNHHTSFGLEAVAFLKYKCKKFNIPFLVHSIGRVKETGESQEDYWRKERYSFYSYLPGPVITAHNLNDCVEWYLFSSLHGKGKLIPYRNSNVIRPFLLASKEQILNWNSRKSVEYLNDPANEDERYMRSIVRWKILPEALRVNPGLLTVIQKQIKVAYCDEGTKL